MSFIPEEVINEVKENIDITELISQYIQLNKRGTNFMASCPFHEDRNPSFSVSQPKQIYKCFSCGRGGNVFGFLQEMEGISFPEAVAKAAEFANITLPAEYVNSQAKTSQNKTNNVLYSLHQKVNDFYHYYLMNTNNGEPALNYLLKRELTKETLVEFQIGLAPSNSDTLVQYLLKSDFTEENLIESGIFYLNTSNRLIDRFRDRIIFPLRNAQGKVIAFSGRTYLEKSEGQASAKYLNSPDTPIFNKGNLIFNIDKARLTIRQKNQVLITEGYMDVISLYQAGFENAVATMGTSLTSSHLNQISKQTNKFYFVFDGDDAGQKAIYQAFEATKTLANIEARAVRIPNKMDPDEWLKQKGANGLQNLINQAVSYFEFNRDYLKRDYNLNNEDELAKYIEQVIILIANLPSPIEQQLWIQDLVSDYGLSEQVLQEQVARSQQIHKDTRTVSTQHNNQYDSIPDYQSIASYDEEIQSLTIESKRAYQSEKLIIFSLIFYDEAWKYIEELESPPIFYHKFTNQAFFALDKYYYDGNKLPLTGIVDTIDNTLVNHFLTSLLWEVELVGYSEEALDDCFEVIRVEFINKEINELRDKMIQFKKENNYIELQSAMNRIISLTRQIKLHKGDGII